MATVKQYIKSNLTIAFMFMSVVCLAQTKTDSLKQYFSSAKTEIEAMLSNKIPLDYERAVFITENAFYENAMDYTVFKENIDFHIQNIQFISSKCAEVNTVTTTQKITISKDSANKNIQRAFDNFAIYKYITDTTFFVFDSTTYYHPKFQYQFSDPFATKNWQTSQVTNLLNEETNTGNCNALTTLFKLFSLRLNSNAKLCTAPNHIFIRHANENGIFFNIELASQSFPGTGSIETISYTTDQAARSGIAMRELDLKQSINLLLINLAKGYERKFNNKSDKFILDCADLSLKYDNLNLNAMLLKAEYLNDKMVSSKKSVTQLQTNTDFIALQKQIATLYNLGYREMPTEMKNRLMSALMQDTTYITLSQNKIYNPFTNAYKTYNRSFSLSNGLFEEVNTNKPKEVFFNIVFDTKTKHITELKQIDNLYNNYEFDAVVFALSVDPLAAKFPYQSPYAFVGNSPILNVEFDGRDYGVYIDHSTKTIIIKATFYTAKGDENSHNSAVKATQYWNDQSGKFQYRVETDQGYAFYDVKFDIKVDNTKEKPESEISKEIMVSKQWETNIETEVVTKTGGAETNLYAVVPNGSIKQNGDEKYTVGRNKFGYDVSVEESNKLNDTGPHEVGHGLGAKHLTNTIMSEALNQNHKGTSSENVIGAMLKNVGIGTTRSDYVNKAATGTINETGKAPDNFKTGKIVTK